MGQPLGGWVSCQGGSAEGVSWGGQGDGSAGGGSAVGVSCQGRGVGQLGGQPPGGSAGGVGQPKGVSWGGVGQLGGSARGVGQLGGSTGRGGWLLGEVSWGGPTSVVSKLQLSSSAVSWPYIAFCPMELWVMLQSIMGVKKKNSDPPVDKLTK